MDDISAVLDVIGSIRPSLVGISTSANVCALFAATYPELCKCLVLERPLPRAIRSADYPYGETEEYWLNWVRSVREQYGDREFLEEWARELDSSLAESQDALDWFVWQRRMAASPASAADWARMSMDTDITDVLASIRIPTLVLHPESERGLARFVSERIRDARTIEVQSVYSIAAADAILEFVHGETLPTIPDSVLATVLFTDLVGSTERAAALGDRAWRDVLSRHHEDVRRELARFRGEEVDSAGDGFFCRFDGPARAMACARAIVDGAKALDLDVRAGIHTGECELVGPKIAGIAVVTGARISSLAKPGEVLVSSTVRDLVAGSGFIFTDRGEQELKGVPGTWRLYAVVDG